MKIRVKDIREEAVDDFFMMLSELAKSKDVMINGVNKPMELRSLHRIQLSMNEILEVKSKFE